MQIITDDFNTYMENLLSLRHNATPGQWKAYQESEEDPLLYFIRAEDEKSKERGIIDCEHKVNAQCIAEAVNAIKPLIERIKTLEAEKLCLAMQCVKFGDKTPRESMTYWIGAAEREVANLQQ